VWDANVPLHEWTYDLKDRLVIYVDALRKVKSDEKEPTPPPLEHSREGEEVEEQQPIHHLAF